MPIKRKTTAKKAAPKKAAPLGPKAKLMKLQVTTLRNKAKKLGVKDITKKSKETLAQSIILAEARKKRGTAAGKRATAKRKAVRSTDPNRQINVPAKGSSSYWADVSKEALAPGRRVSKAGKVYYERRANRSDVPGTFAGEKYLGWTNFETWKFNLELLDPEHWGDAVRDGMFESAYDLAQGIKADADQMLDEVYPGWAFGWVNAAFNDVNWMELASHIYEDYGGELSGSKSMRGSKTFTPDPRKVYGGTGAKEGMVLVKQDGFKKILDLSKKNPSNVFLVSDDNYTNFGPYYVKNGKVAKYTVANPNYDFERNKVRSVKVPNDVILKFKVVE